MVPNRWDVRPLADIALITSGGTPSRTKPEFWQNGTIPWIRTTEVQNCILTPDDVQEYISEEGLKGSSAKLVPSGTVLLAMIGQGKTRGQVALLRFESTINQNCAAIIFNNDQEPYFHFNFLLSQYETIRSMSNSAGQSNLSGALVKTIKVPVPPLAEQKKIAKILSVWDKAITITEKLLANSQQQKKALMQQLITGNRRFPEFKGRWEKRALSEICILGAGQPAPQEEKYFIDGNHDFLRVSDLGSNTCRWAPQSRDKVNQSAIRECKLGVVPARATLFTKSGASLLLNQRAQLKENSFIVSHLGFAKAKDGVSDDFVFYLMCSIDFNRYAAGTSLPALQLSVLKSLKVLVPPYEEQKKIASMFSDADVEISILEKKLFLLKKEKKALMQQLLTGKRRVKVDAA
ncbi:restriction endonuclease subunit S [Yersinia alsatica]|uniref:restriction endonuclease subunit S n=1 Tax=Yersinia alsatica TaxID=2890317 RepID=UPI0011AA4DB5|nr:restriction endonuclease subunit S [Yersinia alsatica]